MGNVLTDGLSTIWTPAVVRANVFLTASISASSWYPNSTSPQATYRPDFVTGSLKPDLPTATTELGFFKIPGNFQAAGNTSWLSAGTNGPDDQDLFFDLDNGTGRTEVINAMVISSPTNTAWQAGGYSISASQDANTWTPLTGSTYYAANSAPATGYDATMTFSNTTAYRHYKIRLKNTAGAYDGISQVFGWDVNKFTGGGSTHGSASANLLNPSEANVTGSFKGESTSHTTLAKLTSAERDNYGWYFNEDIGSADLNWGDGAKLFRGIFWLGYSNTQYYPGKFQVYKSNTGAFNDWDLVNTIDMNAQQDFVDYGYWFLDFGTPIKTQYLRMVFYEEAAEDNPNNTTLAWNGWMYEMVSASAPPAPTNLTTVAQDSNVALTWTQNSGSDNRLFDIFYNLERSDDAGSSYTKIATISGSFIPLADTGSSGTNTPTYYVDTSVADGDYLYRVQAANIHHLTTGSYVTSDSITLPVAGAAASKKIYITNKGNVMINPNDTTLIEI
jgi:hypothetical protein